MIPIDRAALVFCVLLGALSGRAAADQNAAPVLPVAIFPFDERGVGAKDLGSKIGDLLFAKLVVRPELVLVERVDLKKLLDEQALSLSGLVKPGETAKVGQLTGAKLMVAGSVVHADKQLFLIARIIGTETSRVAGASVSGKAADDLAPLVEKLAEGIVDVIHKQGDKLAPKPLPAPDRLAALAKRLPKGPRLSVMINLPERHVGQATIDPAAQTEVARFCKETGHAIIDAQEGTRGSADVLLVGEGFSEFAARTGNLVSVKARVELKAIDRKTGKVLAVDRQTALMVEVSEQIAGKSALQECGAILAERIIPQLYKR